MARDGTDLAYLSLTEAAAAIHAGDVTSRRPTEVVLARAHRRESDLNAFVTLMDGAAVAEADAADRRRSAAVGDRPFWILCAAAAVEAAVGASARRPPLP